MSRKGMKAALEYGKRLPEFPDHQSAETDLFQLRDQLIKEISDASLQSDIFSPDFSPESLKSLEKWYFILWETDSFRKTGMDRKHFERCMAMYKGEVYVRYSSEFEWFVSEYAFLPGRYEIGVKKHLVSIMINRETDLYKRADNIRQQSLWIEFQKWNKPKP